MGYFTRITNPAAYCGGIKKNSFEGWYFKLISKDGKSVLSLIPGVSNCGGEKHAFIQVIDSVSNKTEYIRYDIESFKAEKAGKGFAVRLGDSYFSNSRIAVNIKGGVFSIYGSLKFEDVVPFPKTVWRPSIMGPFAFVPCMECYHCVINIRHTLKGSLIINGEKICFDNGRGYIEKDSGRSFPSAWIWVQACSFEAHDTCFMFSAADIPFLRSRFTGIISFLYHDGKYRPLATYNGCKITGFREENGRLSLSLQNKRHRLAFTVCSDAAGKLKAPVKGQMCRDIEESVSAKVAVKLWDKSGKILFEGESINAGLELCGDYKSLINAAQAPL